MGEFSSSLPQHPFNQLKFDPAVERTDGCALDEPSADHFRYQIEWGVEMKHRVIVNDIKLDLTGLP